MGVSGDDPGESVGRQARPDWLRFLVGALAVVACLLPALLLPRGPYFIWPTAWFVAVGGNEAGLLVAGAIFVPLLPLVSYRRRDWLFISFVPIWGFVVAARVGWRIANLPNRDWPRRPDELTAASGPTATSLAP